MGMRLGIPSKTKVPFPEQVEKYLIKRKDCLSLESNLGKGALAKKLHSSYQVESIIREILERSGFILSRCQMKHTAQGITIFLDLFHRSRTTNKSTLFPQEKNLERGTSRKPQWTSRRGVFWRNLDSSDFALLSQFFESYLTGGLPFRFKLRLLNLPDEDIEERSLVKNLLRYSRSHFFQDGVQILKILQKEPGASLLNQYIQGELRELSRHRPFLLFVFAAMEEAMKTEGSLLRGALIQIKGRVDGSSRSQTLRSRQGSIPLHTLNAPVDYSYGQVRTRYGIYGIKIWLQYS